MMMSFLAQLIKSTNDTHSYRVIMDGGERFAYLVLDIESGEIFSSTSTGEPAGDMQLSLEDGNMQPSTASGASEAEDASMSPEEFALVSGSIRREWLKERTAPSKVVKYYG
ncbi:hypothetical protein [Streptomyces litchfieldiae]|uniref:Uncharacterized protein n=1 Tax=Streptomyces litchfieldiae TaxID=3075543 RepID=A0ABU2MNR2_9ACTN|nr:hypothetical protein [Streptomyces sp. DSM 44938]MDT0342719.1 hypothetical protein [Streptomyces sp. DSM 44938]